MTWRDIAGWFDFEEVYAARVQAAQDGDVFVEVGSWLGKSTAFMAGEVKASGKAISFYAVDWWLGAASDSVNYNLANPYERFVANMVTCGVAPWVKPIRLRSTEAARFFLDGSLAFVWIDADHCYAAVREDILTWLPKVREDGWIGGHDYMNHPEVRQAVDEVFPSVEVVGASWLVGLSQKDRVPEVAAAIV